MISLPKGKSDLMKIAFDRLWIRQVPRCRGSTSLTLPDRLRRVGGTGKLVVSDIVLGSTVLARITFDCVRGRWTPRCPGSVSPTLQDRLRGVTWTGNLLVGGFVLGLGTWSTFASLESAAVATGTIESESSRKTIQHFEGGIIKQIIVADGDVVRAGQTLILLDDTKARSEVQSLRGQLWDAVAREARLLAEQHGYERVSFPTDLQEEQKSNPGAAAVVAAQQSIFETRRQVV
jgi:HlyD family secretion protein